MNKTIGFKYYIKIIALLVAVLFVFEQVAWAAPVTSHSLEPTVSRVNFAILRPQPVRERLINRKPNINSFKNLESLKAFLQEVLTSRGLQLSNKQLTGLCKRILGKKPRLGYLTREKFLSVLMKSPGVKNVHKEAIAETVAVGPTRRQILGIGGAALLSGVAITTGLMLKTEPEKKTPKPTTHPVAQEEGVIWVLGGHESMKDTALLIAELRRTEKAGAKKRILIREAAAISLHLFSLAAPELVAHISKDRVKELIRILEEFGGDETKFEAWARNGDSTLHKLAKGIVDERVRKRKGLEEYITQARTDQDFIQHLMKTKDDPWAPMLAYLARHPDVVFMTEQEPLMSTLCVFLWDLNSIDSPKYLFRDIDENKFHETFVESFLYQERMIEIRNRTMARDLVEPLLTKENRGVPIIISIGKSHKDIVSCVNDYKGYAVRTVIDKGMQWEWMPFWEANKERIYAEHSHGEHSFLIDKGRRMALSWAMGAILQGVVKKGISSGQIVEAVNNITKNMSEAELEESVKFIQARIAKINPALTEEPQNLDTFLLMYTMAWLNDHNKIPEAAKSSMDGLYLQLSIKIVDDTVKECEQRSGAMFIPRGMTPAQAGISLLLFGTSLGEKLAGETVFLLESQI